MLIDPLDLTQEDMPVFVFSDDRRSFIGWAIKAHSKGNYNHIMIMVNPCRVVTQGGTYKEIPIKRYMKPFIHLKFWKCHNITPAEAYQIFNKVGKDLKLPWWRKLYDFIGIVGHLVGVRWVNIPWLSYCSERVLSYVRVILKDVESRQSPAELNELFKKEKRMTLIGHWWED